MNSIAQKTIMKIEKENGKLENLLTKKNDIQETFQLKLSEIEKEIAEQKKIIVNLKMQEKQEKLEAISVLAGKSGVSVDDILSAVLEGNFDGIKKLEKKQKFLNIKNENVEPDKEEEPEVSVPVE